MQFDQPGPITKSLREHHFLPTASASRLTQEERVLSTSSETTMNRMNSLIS
ncbi:uncharacterized protein METZ01_LOCUS195083, partial [marine metagenome]